jgi:hypothetical protein
MSNKLNPAQTALLTLLRANPGATITQAAILAATKWKDTAWRVYCTNGLYSPFLQEESKGLFKVHLPADLTDEQFALAVTQSRRRSPFKHALTDRLVERATDNFALALECYNRPTLANRIDAFALLCVTAWEQLLKARLVEKAGPDAVLLAQKPGRRRESIGLPAAIAVAFPDAKDPVRQNLEAVAELRNEAAHLAVRDLQSHYARLFQACVFNFSRQFKDFTGKPPLPTHNVGLLALASTPDQLSAAPLEKLYGAVVASEILSRVQRLADTERELDDSRFAIPVEYTLTLARGKASGDVHLVDAANAPLDAVIFHKATDPDRTWKYRAKELGALVASRLGIQFSTVDLLAVAFKEGWKKADNEFHRLSKNPDTHKYSDAALEAIVKHCTADPTYLARCRQSHAHSRVQPKRIKQRLPSTQRNGGQSDD